MLNLFADTKAKVTSLDKRKLNLENKEKKAFQVFVLISFLET